MRAAAAALLALVLLPGLGRAWDNDNLPPGVLPAQQFDSDLQKAKQDFSTQYQHADRRMLEGKLDALHGVYHEVRDGKHLYRADLPAAALPTETMWNQLSGTIGEFYAVAEARATHASKEQLAALLKKAHSDLDAFVKTPAGQAIRDRLRPPPGSHRPGTAGHSDGPLMSPDPSDPFGHVFNGNAKLAEGDPRSAKQLANNALALDPQNSDAYSLRAAAEMDLKQYPAAAGDAAAALALNPADERSKAVLMLAHATVESRYKQPDQTPRADEDAGPGAVSAEAGPQRRSSLSISQTPVQASVLAGEARRALDLGDYGAAISQAGRAIDLDPQNANAYALRAMAEEKAGKYDAAARDAAAALELDPSNRLAQNVRGKSLNEMRRFNDALAAADEGLRRNPRNAYLEYMRAMALNGLGDRAGALDSLRRAAAIDSRFQDAVDLAQEQPGEKDLGFLFPEDRLAAAKAALAKRRPDASRDWKRLYVLSVCAGAALLVVLWWVLPWLQTLKERWSHARPALGSHQTFGSGLPTPLPTPTLATTGVVLRGQYRRLGQIGASVHGAVYEGLDLALDRRVTIRKLRADYQSDDRERLLAPARLAAALNHPGIAMLYAVLDEPDALYLVSEFAPGKTLRDLLAARGPLPAEEALPLFRRLAQAVDHAHARGVVHGAIKASNVMIGQDGSPKLLDFGLDRGPADPLADRQAFSACLREAIAGLAPHQLDVVDAALARRRGIWGSCAEVVDAVRDAVEAHS